MFGDSVRISDEYAMWWSYIPHFIHTPGYVYAYAFGNLLALAIYAALRGGRARPSCPRTSKLLSAGGSDRPEALAALVGVDLTDPGFWNAGLAVIGDLVDEAEKLADSVT